MPLASVQSFVQSQLNGLAMPVSIPNLVAHIAPPVVADLATQPLAFVWGGQLTEKRATMAGGRNSTINTTSGIHNLVWQIDIYLKYAMSPDDTNLQVAFPLVVDYVMQKLRGITIPVNITDATTGWQTKIVDIGEEMTMTYGDVHTLSDQRFELFEAQIICQVQERVQQ